MINEIKDKDIFLHIQKKWDVRFPNLKLIVLDDEKSKAYRFTWEVNTPHIQDAHGKWEAIDKADLASEYVPQIFVYMIEKMEAEFTKFAIEHYLRG